MAEHRVELEQAFADLFEMLGVVPIFCASSRISSLFLGQELMQRRIEQANGDRQPGHLRRMPTKSSRCIGRIFASALARCLAFSAMIISRTASMRSGAEEHMLGAAQADALGAEIARDLRVMRRVGIGAHTQRALLVGPRHELGEEGRHLRLDGRHPPEDNLARGAVEGDEFAATNDVSPAFILPSL